MTFPDTLFGIQATQPNQPTNQPTTRSSASRSLSFSPKAASSHGARACTLQAIRGEGPMALWLALGLQLTGRIVPKFPSQFLIFRGPRGFHGFRFLTSGFHMASTELGLGLRCTQLPCWTPRISRCPKGALARLPSGFPCDCSCHQIILACRTNPVWRKKNKSKQHALEGVNLPQNGVRRQTPASNNLFESLRRMQDNQRVWGPWYIVGLCVCALFVVNHKHYLRAGWNQHKLASQVSGGIGGKSL